MKFPLSAPIQPVPYNKQEGVILQVDGNGGAWPPQWPYSIKAKDGTVLANGVAPMDEKQWESWKRSPDSDGYYILDCVADYAEVQLLEDDGALSARLTKESNP